MTKLLLASLLACAACAKPGYYVADIKPAVGGIDVTKCAFDDRGKATTDNCTTEMVPIAAAVPPAMMDEPPAEPARAPRPAPSAEQIAAAFAAPAVHALVLQCRDTYAKGATSFAFKVTIEHSGRIKNVEPADKSNLAFSDCAARALGTANIARFDGPPITVDQTLAL